MSQFSNQVPPPMPPGLDPRVDPSAGPIAEAAPQRITPTLWLWGIVFMTLVLFGVYKSTVGAPSGVSWESDLEDGLAEAKANDQLVLVAFKTSRCPACVQMDKEVLSTEPVERALSSWVPVKVDLGWNSRLGEKYNITAVPTYIILSPDGATLDYAVGTRDVSSFVGWLDRAKSKYRERRKTSIAEVD